MEEQKNKIAIVSCKYFESGYDGEFFNLISRGITDWVEVTDQEYNDIARGLSLLNSKLRNSYHYTLIQQHQTQDLVFESIEEVKQAFKKEKEYKDKLEEEKTKKQKLRELKQKEKSKKERKQLYEKLKQEFESNENQK
jgi:hypothetical protein